MKIVIGHKVLNLEELTNVANLGVDLAEVIIDSQLYAELATQAPPKTIEAPQFTSIKSDDSEKLLLSKAQFRAALLVKLVQLLKLKKNAQKSTIDFFVGILNNSQGDNVVQCEFYDHLSELIQAQGVRLSEKEVFVLEAPQHVLQAVVALEAYKVKENMSLYDATLSFSCELFACHSDNFTDFALTLGKSSQGITQFRTHVQAMVDGSKLLAVGDSKIDETQEAGKPLNPHMLLPEVFQAHGGLHERSLQLCQQLMQDLNADYPSLFNEKKNRELQKIAARSQESILAQVRSQGQSLFQCLHTVALRSQNRCENLEEGKQDEAEIQQLKSFGSAICALGKDVVGKMFKKELGIAFAQAKERDSVIKAKKSDGKADNKKKPKKNAAPAPPPGLQLGKGSRAFLDFLLDQLAHAQDGGLLASQDPIKFNVSLNKELQGELAEILQVRNQERRLPKCAKGTRDMTPLQMAIREKAFNQIREIFFKHGCCEIDTPVFELKETLTGKYGEDSKLIYDLQDQGGELLALRYDLTVPFARYCASERVQQIKRFHMAKVYRRDQPQMSKGRFREFYQCDFDIAGDYAPMIPDAEVLSVVQEILTTLDIGQFTVKVNHRKFLDAMVDLAGCEKRKFKTICSSIDKLDKEPWEKVKNELINQKGLTEAMTDKLHRFVQFQGKPWEMLAELKASAVFEGHESAMNTINEMEVLFGYLDAMGALDNILFDFSLARGLDYYTGLIYEAVLTGSDRGSIAGGGRYDGLVGMFSGKDIPAVGVSIGIERIFAILERKATEEKQVRATKTQILIAQIGKNLTKERMKILGELWRAGVCAETLYVDNPKTAKQLDFAFDNGIPLVMWIGEDEVARGVVKVKSLSFHEEQFIERVNMVEKVKELIAKNPFLLSKEQQQEVLNSTGAGGASSGAKKSGKPIAERLDELEGQLIQTQWLGGQQMSSLDKEAFDAIAAAGGASLMSPLMTPNLWGWFSMVSKFKPELRAGWPQMKAPASAAAAKPESGDGNKRGQGKGKGAAEGKGAAKGRGAAEGKGKKGAAKQESKKPKAAEEEFDDLFDADPEADAAAAEALKKKTEAGKAKAKKAGPIAKSLIIWEVKPWGEETDLQVLADKILAIEMDGLFWKTEWKKEPVAYGIFKIVIGATVEDEKVSTDDVQEKIEQFEDDVQSVDIVAFNKL